MTENNNSGSQINLLDKYGTPQKMKTLDLKELQQLCDELREETIRIVAKTGGHLGAGLGVVELTVALHYIFDTPNDKIIWDVGHQAYPHKILTNRREQMHSLRKHDGISGFTKRSESIYDPFGAGHSSTSISAALGMAVARDLKGENNEVIAVIGDGAMSAGMAYEAMNNAGSMNSRLIVILNDNDMSIARPVGAFSNYLSKLISSSPYLNFRNKAKQWLSHFPKQFESAARKAEYMAKTIATGGNFFEEMGFYYVGPVDGHNLEHLITILKNIKEDHTIKHPVLIHAITEKGRGFSPESDKEKYHAVSKFDLATRVQQKTVTTAPTYTKIFAQSLINEAKQDDKIVAITAAMPSGTGLDLFASHFPERTFDVGIAEQHAVTFAAGLACEGLKPFVAIYSTFLQRAYDQIVHDVAIQQLPVKFAIDRAGLVGADGPTHAGSYDIAFLANLPEFIIMAASDEVELQAMVKTAASIDYAPCAFRYPRGEGLGIIMPENPSLLAIGKGRIIQKGEKIAILSFGARLKEVNNAAKILAEQHNINITIADARFAKPLDQELINDLARNHELLITIEEGSFGGFGSVVLDYLINSKQQYKNLKIRNLHLPDEFIQQHENVSLMYGIAGLDSDHIVKTVLMNLQ